MTTLGKFFLTASMAALTTLTTAGGEARAQQRPGRGQAQPVAQRHGRISELAHRLEQQARHPR